MEFARKSTAMKGFLDSLAQELRKLTHNLLPAAE